MFQYLMRGHTTVYATYSCEFKSQLLQKDINFKIHFMREFSSILDNTIIYDTTDINIKQLKLSGGHSIFFPHSYLLDAVFWFFFQI